MTLFSLSFLLEGRDAKRIRLANFKIMFQLSDLSKTVCYFSVANIYTNYLRNRYSFM